VKEKFFTMKNKQKLEIEKQTKNKKPKNFTPRIQTQSTARSRSLYHPKTVLFFLPWTGGRRFTQPLLSMSGGNWT